MPSGKRLLIEQFVLAEELNRPIRGAVDADLAAPDRGRSDSPNPICAPESKPKKSPASSPKSPWPSGRPKRCVSRNANLCLRQAQGGRQRRDVEIGLRVVRIQVRIVVLRAAAMRRRRWLASVGGRLRPDGRGHAQRQQSHERQRDQSKSLTSCLLIVLGAELDPAADDANLSVGQVRPASAASARPTISTSLLAC